jgi:hypothetical protein
VRGGRRPDMILRVGILARISKIQKVRPQSKGGPLPVSGHFAAKGHFIQCLPGPEGGGVDVASYIPGPARGPVCS